MAMATRDTTTAATKNIMPTRGPTRAGGIWPEWGRIAVGLCLGIALVYLAVPRTMAAFLHLPGNPILETIQTGGSASGAELQILADSRENGLTWVDAGRAWTDLSLAYLTLAEEAGYDTDVGAAYLAQSVRALKTGSSKGPANPYAWARLTFLGLESNGPEVESKSALIMSLFTGPYERSLAQSRIQYGITLWHRLDAAQQALIYDQIVFLDRFEPRQVIEIARQNQKSRIIVLTALADRPKRQAALRAALGKR